MCVSITKNGAEIPMDEFYRLMREYGEKKARTLRTSRAYLRSLGLVLDRNGVVIGVK